MAWYRIGEVSAETLESYSWTRRYVIFRDGVDISYCWTLREAVLLTGLYRLQDMIFDFNCDDLQGVER